MIDRWRSLAGQALPEDASDALLVGRAWSPADGGPSVIVLRGSTVFDLSRTFPTMSDLTEHDDPATAVRDADGPALGEVTALIANSIPDTRDSAYPWLLSPIDLHVVKAAGVTFPVSMLERIIEERAHGDLDLAARIRSEVLTTLGAELQSLTPGSPEAARLKDLLVEKGLWSQYLEVGIGPDAEVFTKAPVLSTVGTAVEVGIRSDSVWNNPEPEVVLAVNNRGDVVGATLGNDVNLRDFEGRSALLLSKAKDNNASCALGPFFRLFDRTFSFDDVRNMELRMEVAGPDGFRLEAASAMSRISRDPQTIVDQTIGTHHQYPDGFVLFLGTMFAPVMDRDEPGKGFTHKVGDIVRIRSASLGMLANRVNHSEAIEPWTFGLSALMRNLAKRGLLG